MRVKAFQVDKPGAASALKWRTVELAKPGRGQVLVRHTAVGLNFIDIYHRTGLYPVPIPTGIGLEAAGVVEACGPGVQYVKVGDRVAYATGPIGAYAEARIMPEATLIKLPRGVDDATAAAYLLKGMTVEYLFHRTYPVKKGETILFLPAAGGVGLIAGQWAAALGAQAIGLAGGPAKCRIAKKHGYSKVIDYRKYKNFSDKVRALTKGEGVPVVYDGVGKATWDESLKCLRLRGLMVSFGNASGAVTDIDLGSLGVHGSLYLTRPSLMHYTTTRKDLEHCARRTLHMLTSGKVRPPDPTVYALKDAAKAHRDLAARKTTGAAILLVDQ